MRNALLALGALSAAATVQPAMAQPSDDPAPAKKTLQQAETARPQRDGPMMVGAHFPPHGPRGAMHASPAGMSPETMLAARLAMLETRIGIRTEQLDAWRDYTGALQALLPPPGRPADFGGRGRDTAPDAVPEGARDPFGFEEELADDFAKRAAAAERLKGAIAALRTMLTPEQLEIMASTERLGVPPLGPWGKDVPSETAAGGSPHGEQPPKQLPAAEGQP